MKIIDILKEVKSKRSAAHYIKLENKELLLKQLKILSEENILNQYKMTYAYRELEDCILLILYKQFNFIR